MQYSCIAWIGVTCVPNGRQCTVGHIIGVHIFQWHIRVDFHIVQKADTNAKHHAIHAAQIVGPAGQRIR